MNTLYVFVRFIARFWIWFFFKSVEVRYLERVPSEGPVLLCINHPNNLIDSLLVGAVVSRKVHYVGTAALFRNPLMARLLDALGVIPIYRRQDDPDKMERNIDAFEACFDALENDQLIAIYPEGTTHAEPRVQRIKTGAARIALEAEARRWGALGLALIPVGLNFDARKSFKNRVLVAFGDQISLSPYLAHYRDDPRKAVDALTSVIQWGMESQVIHVERIELTEVVREVEALYRVDLARELQQDRGFSPKQIDVFRLSRAIVAAVHYFKARDPDRVERIWQRIQAYKALLAEYGIKDQAVHGRLQPASSGIGLGRSALAFVGFPLFAYGFAVNALPYFFPRWLARRLTKKETDYATVRFLSSIVLFPFFWAVETWVVWRLTEIKAALLFLASVPVTGLVAYHYLGRLARLRHMLRFARLAFTRRRAATRIMAVRREILQELDRAKYDYLTATKGSSF
ncbi:MAG: lysophospholipid acyltransferase family protein [Candidatus Methylomirabilia bacterium]